MRCQIAIPTFAVGALLVGACGPDYDSPGPGIRPTEVTALAVEGPTTVSAGGSAQYRTLRRGYADSTMLDVTGEAEWISSNPAVLSIDGGVATGLSLGNASVHARLKGQESRPVQVLVWVDYSGVYTLTIGGGTCAGAGALPPELTLRTYTAHVSQTLPPTVAVRLSGPRFEESYQYYAFAGQPGSGGVTFPLLPGSIDYWAPVTEALPDGTWLEIVGEAVTTPSTSGLSGAFRGTFTRWSFDTTNGYRIIGSCESAAHQFTLSR